MVIATLAVYLQRNEISSISSPCTKFNLKFIIDFNLKPEMETAKGKQEIHSKLLAREVSEKTKQKL